MTIRTLKTILLVACALTILNAPAQSQGDATNAPAARIRIGIYDSRSVAIAYAGSAAFNESLRGLKSEYDRAQTAGNQQRMAELRAEGAAGQRLLHMQGFSTAPVTNILDQVRDKLPAVREKAGVSVLVSKWDQPALASHQNAELVDVTPALIDLFNPTEKQRKSAQEIQKHEPISLKEAEQIK